LPIHLRAESIRIKEREMRIHAAAVLVLLAGCASPNEVAPAPEGEGESPVTQVTEGRHGEDKDPEISPDGRVLYYASSSHGETLDLYMKTIGSNTAVRLTTFPGDKRFPRVNPVNPRILAFSTNTRGPWEIGILDSAGDPGKVQFVSESGMHSLHPSWSPDGRKIVYCATENIGSGEWILKVLDITTGKTHTFEEVDGLLPGWSPRGNTIAFQRMKHRDGWLGSIWTAEFEAGSMRNLTMVFSSDDWAVINPSWSPDGNHIVFATVGKSKARSGILTEGDDVWTIGADGSNPSRLTTSSAADWMPTWGSNGWIYFVSDRTGSHRIWSLKAPATNEKTDSLRAKR
jgi:TolB protein